MVYTRVLQGSRFGGEFNDCALDITAIAADRAGAAYVTGCTTATDFPLVRPFRSTPSGSRGSAFVVKLDAAGNIVYSTYFGSGNADGGTGVTADDQGNAYVTGTGNGLNLPLVNPAATRGSGFLAKFNASGSALLYSTYVRQIARPRSRWIGRAPRTSGLRHARRRPCARSSRAGTSPGRDAIVIKVIPPGSRFDYATCLGGLDDDTATGIAVDPAGSAYVVGTTKSLDFPILHPLDVPIRTGPLWKTSDAGLASTTSARCIHRQRARTLEGGSRGVVSRDAGRRVQEHRWRSVIGGTSACRCVWAGSSRRCSTSQSTRGRRRRDLRGDLRRPGQDHR